MEGSSSVVRLRQPDAIDDPLTEVLRAGARQPLAQAVELEVDPFWPSGQSLRDAETGFAQAPRGLPIRVHDGDGPAPAGNGDRGETGPQPTPGASAKASTRRTADFGRTGSHPFN